MRQCKPSWIDTYLEYTSNQESPKSFHQWVGMSLISGMLKRNVWIPRVKYTTYPNLYVILVASSAKCRKSIALQLGRDILSATKKPPNIFAQKITTEALIESLEEGNKKGTCHGIIFASELSVFLGADAIRSGIIPALTDLYDSPKQWVYHTRGRGKETLKNVTLGMVAASTKDWLRSSIPVEAIGGGFTSRIIFVTEEGPSKLILFGEEDNDRRDEKLRASLVTDLNDIGKLSGAVTFSKGAKDLALEWYKKEASEIRDEKTDGYFGRKHDTMFKVAVILSVSEGSSLEVLPKHIKKALEIMERNERHLSTIMASVTSTNFGGTTEKVFSLIKKHGTIKHSDLLKKCWRYANATEFCEMMRTLLESGEVRETLDGNNKRVYNCG